MSDPIFIPYGGYSLGKELTYCVNSLKNNLKEKHEIVVYATRGCEVDLDVDVEWCNPNEYGGIYAGVDDLRRKIRAFAKRCDSESFFNVHDDVVLIRPVKRLKDVVNYRMPKLLDIRDIDWYRLHYDSNKYS